jgi:hypothetical protein
MYVGMRDVPGSAGIPAGDVCPTSNSPAGMPALPRIAVDTMVRTAERELTFDAEMEE